MLNKETYDLQPIGYVRVGEDGARFELLPEFASGLAGLEGFSHVIVVWWCHYVDNEEYRSMVSAGKPYVKGPDEMGIFATRSPVRPNPIAFSAVPVSGLDGANGVIEAPWIDAEDGSPILDIKPYSPCIDRVATASVPAWCAHWPASLEENEGFDWGAEFNF